VEFYLTRTTDSDLQPCDEAYQRDYFYVDRRTAKDPKELGQYGADWYENGTNHRLEDGMIARDIPQPGGWFIELTNLLDLLEFVNKHGRVIIEPISNRVKDTYEIEIYDDYRE
jgi:hypothetical protein